MKNLSARARDIRDAGSIPGSGDPLEEGSSIFCLENSMDRGACLLQGCKKLDTTEMT